MLNMSVTKRYGYEIKPGMKLKIPRYHHIVASVRCNEHLRFEIKRITNSWGDRALVMKPLNISNLTRDDFTHTNREGMTAQGHWANSHAFISDILNGKEIRVPINTLTKAMMRNHLVYQEEPELVTELEDFLL